MKSSGAVFVVVGILSGLSLSRADARTWRVTPDGTGDAPNIEAAMDGCAVGDSVLVAPGEYLVAQVLLADRVVLIGEEGPLRTRLVPDPEPTFLSGLGCWSVSADIIGLWFDGFHSSAGWGALNVSGVARVTGCLFTNNMFGVTVTGGHVDAEGNTFVNNDLAIRVDWGTGVLRRNVIWDFTQGLGSIVGYCNDVLRLEDIYEMYRPINFSLDPQFCGANDYHLSASSPCAPGNTPLNDDCGLIGALPVNRSTTAVEERTWGQIKALYRKAR